MTDTWAARGGVSSRKEAAIQQKQNQSSDGSPRWVPDREGSALSPDLPSPLVFQQIQEEEAGPGEAGGAGQYWLRRMLKFIEPGGCRQKWRDRLYDIILSRPGIKRERRR